VKTYMCIRLLEDDGETERPAHFRVVAEIDYEELQEVCDANVKMRQEQEAFYVERIAQLEAENERLMSQVCQWSEACTGRNGSQMQCVTADGEADGT
jgi:hypothetical protein